MVENDLNEEHIIPQSIGGRLTEFLYCVKCNSVFGDSLDVEISNHFGRFGTILNIRRKRGKNQPVKDKAIDSGTELSFNGKQLKRANPIVNYKINEDGNTLESADITARSEDELEKIINGLRKKYTISENFRLFCEHHVGPTDTEHDFIIDSRPIRRAISKIAYGFLCKKLPSIAKSDSLDPMRLYLKYDEGVDLACANYVATSFMVDYRRPFHKIHISCNRRRGFVVGYVTIFGIFRFTVLLAKHRRGVEVADIDYTFEPVSQREVVGNDYFRAPDITEQMVLKPRHTKSLILNELSKGFEIIGDYTDDWEMLRLECI